MGRELSLVKTCTVMSALVVLIAAAIGCGGSRESEDSEMGSLAPFEGPACSDARDCSTDLCVVHPGVPEGAQTEGVCFEPPYFKFECYRYVDDGVATHMVCV